MKRLTDKLTSPREPAATLTLSWEQRTKSRLRVTLDNGETAGLFLERGTILRGNDLLTSDDGDVVRIVAAEESVSTVACDDPLLMARACYHLGNRHTSLEIGEKQIRYLHDPVLDEMVKGLGLHVQRESTPFEPEIGAYAGNGHHHG